MQCTENHSRAQSTLEPKVDIINKGGPISLFGLAQAKGVHLSPTLFLLLCLEVRGIWTLMVLGQVTVFTSYFYDP